MLKKQEVAVGISYHIDLIHLSPDFCISAENYIYKTQFLVSPCLTISPQEELVESEQLDEIYGCFLQVLGVAPRFLCKFSI